MPTGPTLHPITRTHRTFHCNANRISRTRPTLLDPMHVSDYTQTGRSATGKCKFSYDSEDEVGPRCTPTTPIYPFSFTQRHKNPITRHEIPFQTEHITGLRHSGSCLRRTGNCTSYICGATGNAELQKIWNWCRVQDRRPRID